MGQIFERLGGTATSSCAQHLLFCRFVRSGSVTVPVNRSRSWQRQTAARIVLDSVCSTHLYWYTFVLLVLKTEAALCSSASRFQVWASAAVCSGVERSSVVSEMVIILDSRGWAHCNLVSCWYKQEFHFETAICAIAGVWQNTRMVGYIYRTACHVSV